MHTHVCRALKLPHTMCGYQLARQTKKGAKMQDVVCRKCWTPGVEHKGLRKGRHSNIKKSIADICTIAHTQHLPLQPLTDGCSWHRQQAEVDSEGFPHAPPGGERMHTGNARYSQSQTSEACWVNCMQRLTHTVSFTSKSTTHTETDSLHADSALCNNTHGKGRTHSKHNHLGS
jgi:hypothetical protein